MTNAKVKLAKTSDVHAGHTQKTVLIHERFFAEMAEEWAKADGIDALILAGDLISHKQKSMKTLFRTIRNVMPHVPVVACLGNHDYWDEGKYYGGSKCRKYTYQELDEMHKEAFGEFNIHRVSATPLVIKDVAIVGFDGWYAQHNPNTNDKYWMAYQWDGLDPFAFMIKKAAMEFDTLMGMDLTPYRATVGITHFPPFTDHVRYIPYCASMNLMPFMTEKWDVLCVGHSHKACDFVENDCRVINSGSDYDHPRYVVFDV